jgi:glycosyltransferase involved in cell wall biosynthesis
MAPETGSVQAEWSFLGTRVLVVSPFPPKPDGIGRYTDQLLAALPDRQFVRLGIPGGGGDVVRHLSGGLRPLLILAYARGIDDVLVMYHPTYFHHGGGITRLASHLSLWLLSRLAPITFVIHEPDDLRAVNIGRRGKLQFWLLERVRRRLWRDVRALVFHTGWERGSFAARFPAGPRRVERLVTHGNFFVSQIDAPRADARRALDLPHDRAVALLIGFLSPHKRYDRVIDLFGAAGLRGLDLHIVGAPITDWPDVMQHVDDVRAAAARTPNVHMHERFVTDSEFDLWIRAADAVLVPYATASSSGVVARTHLLGTKLISSGAGGIADQLLSADLVYEDDAGLAEALRTVADRQSLAACD